MESRENLIILGRLLGTHTGFDMQDTLAICFYDFEPTEGVPIAACDTLEFNFDSGWGTGHTNDESGAQLGTSFDILDTLKGLPRHGED